MKRTSRNIKWWQLCFFVALIIAGASSIGWYVHLLMGERAVERFFQASQGVDGGSVSGKPRLNWNADILTVTDLKIAYGNSEIFGDVQIKGIRDLGKPVDEARKLTLIFSSKGVKMDGITLQAEWVMSLSLTQENNKADVALDLGLMDAGDGDKQALISLAATLADSPDFLSAINHGLGDKGNLLNLSHEFTEAALMSRPELVRLDISDNGFLHERWRAQLLKAHRNMNTEAVEKVIEAQFVEFEGFVKDKELSKKLRALVLDGQPFHMVATQESPVTIYDLYLIFMGKMLLDPTQGVYKVTIGD